jgi:hypothetical protein
MTKNYTDEELAKIEEAVDKLPEHVKREIFKTPPKEMFKKELPKIKQDKPEKTEKPVKKKEYSSSDSDFLIPPPA